MSALSTQLSRLNRMCLWACACMLCLAAMVGILLAEHPAVAFASEQQASDAPASSGEAISSSSNDARWQEVSASADALVDQSAGGWTSLTLIVSQGGQDVLERTYSHDEEGNLSVSDEASAQAYDWGRTSDLLVWAAVMQLVQDGSLSLESRVGLRLPNGVELPEGYSSLTILDLMNHASGLDVSPASLSGSQGHEGSSVAAALGDFTFTAAYEPGDAVSYSPADAALAAAVVEEVSGLSITDYVRQNILEPLGMEDTCVYVGSSPSAEGEAAAVSAALAAGHDGDAADTTKSFLNNPVISCVGTASDLARLESGLLGLVEADASILSERACETLFSVSRTFASLGTPRIAHGMFVLPLDDEAFGMSGGTWTGFSCAAYMSASEGVAVTVLVDQAWRNDLTQGLSRLVFGTDELDAVLAAGANNPADQQPAEGAQGADEEAAAREDAAGDADAAPSVNMDATIWAGTYEDASLPDHGPAKLLGALGRTLIMTSEQEGGSITLSVLGFDLESLGLGVYRSPADTNGDVMRFHVSLTTGEGFSYVESDAIQVPLPTLVIEGVLLATAALAFLFNAGYVLASLVSLVRARIAHIPWDGQEACFALAGASFLAFGWTLAMLVWPDTAQALSLFPAAQRGNLIYVVVATCLLVWLVVTRWRGCGRTPAHLTGCALCCLCALTTMLNLVYWEMLP